MTPRPSSHDSNPVVGLLHCQCGKLMKVRRRSVGHRGRCKRCGRTLLADEGRLSPLPPHLQARLDRAERPEVDYTPPDDDLEARAFDDVESHWSAELDEPRAPSVLAGAEDAVGDHPPPSEPPAWNESEVPWTPEEASDWEADAGDSALPPPDLRGDTAPERAGCDVSDPFSDADEEAGAWAPVPEPPTAGTVGPQAVSDLDEDEPAENSGSDWRFPDEPVSEESWGEGADPWTPDDAAGKAGRDTSWDAVAPPKFPLASSAPDAERDDEWTPDDVGATWDAVAPPRADERGGVRDTGDAAVAESSGEHEPARLDAADSLAWPTAWDGIAPGSASRMGSGATDFSLPDGPEAAVHAAAASIGQTELPTEETLSEWFEREDDRYQGEGAHAGPPVVEAWQRRLKHRRSSHGQDAEAHHVPDGPAGALGQHRIAWIVFPLSALTLGVYYYVWTYKIFSELRDHIARERYLSPVIAVVFHFVPIVNLFWPSYLLFRAASDVNVLQDLEGRARVANPIAVLTGTILALMLPVVGLGLLANELAYGLGGLAAAPLLWWWATAKVQAALNAHWRLHAQ